MDRRAFIAGTLGLLAAPHRARVLRDGEGWPVIPGTLGRVEWHDGAALAVYTDRPRLFGKLWTIPGVRRRQTGDREMRALVPVEALEQVAGVIRARRRRRPNAGSFPPPAQARFHRPRIALDGRTHTGIWPDPAPAVEWPSNRP